MEHGPRDCFANPAAANPDYQLRLAAAGHFSGIVLHVGLAEKYMAASRLDEGIGPNRRDADARAGEMVQRMNVAWAGIREQLEEIDQPLVVVAFRDLAIFWADIGFIVG